VFCVSELRDNNWSDFYVPGMLSVHWAVQTGSVNKTDFIWSSNDKWFDCFVLMAV
jgi:hypothetical protein